MGAGPFQIALHTIKLLLPALVPSWRFFDTIEPSPRIEFALLEAADSTPDSWQTFRPRPQYVSARTLLRRIIWNPSWNESLFLVSCAERLIAHPTLHSQLEINNRIKKDLAESTLDLTETPYLQFRLVFLSREGNEIEQEICYLSVPCPVSAEGMV
ncbi:MAG: hypothetical protein ABJN40_21925 [Sneathiella sp.]